MILDNAQFDHTNSCNPPVDYTARDEHGALLNVKARIDDDCSGPLPECGAAHREGRPVHIVPPQIADSPGTLVLPTYHYATVSDAMNAVGETFYDSRVVESEAELARAHEAGVAHWVPRGTEPLRREYPGPRYRAYAQEGGTIVLRSGKRLVWSFQIIWDDPEHTLSLAGWRVVGQTETGPREVERIP